MAFSSVSGSHMASSGNTTLGSGRSAATTSSCKPTSAMNLWLQRIQLPVARKCETILSATKALASFSRSAACLASTDDAPQAAVMYFWRNSDTGMLVTSRKASKRSSEHFGNAFTLHPSIYCCSLASLSMIRFFSSGSPLALLPASPPCCFKAPCCLPLPPLLLLGWPWLSLSLLLAALPCGFSSAGLPSAFFPASATSATLLLPSFPSFLLLLGMMLACTAILKSFSTIFLSSNVQHATRPSKVLSSGLGLGSTISFSGFRYRILSTVGSVIRVLRTLWSVERISWMASACSADNFLSLKMCMVTCV
mmetsp:Transcript_22662/g.62558  ORF Transcript_22662/g.62558 Transcript_22662/m.62558 type:complete len:308 (-) Transcript_22662:470-1393(-)